MSDIYEVGSDEPFQPTNASYYRRELKKAQAENAELRAKLFKAEIERGVMFEEYDKLRAKLDAWEKQEPQYFILTEEHQWLSASKKYAKTVPSDRLMIAFTKPKEA